MKTSNQFKLILALLLSLFMIQGLSAAYHPPKNETNESTKSIHHYFKFPHILMPNLAKTKLESVKVEVLFTTNQKGEVNFVLAKTDQVELKKEIENQFLKLSFKNIKCDIVNSVTLTIKTN